MTTSLTTTHHTLRMGPYKLRPVLDRIRGLSVSHALAVLALTPRAAAAAVAKRLVASQAAAIDRSLDPTRLVIRRIAADQQGELKRQRIRSRGRSATMRKRSSSLTIELALRPPTADHRRKKRES
jgi:large subunit ribosomal protein L22